MKKMENEYKEMLDKLIGASVEEPLLLTKLLYNYYRYMGSYYQDMIKPILDHKDFIKIDVTAITEEEYLFSFFLSTDLLDDEAYKLIISFNVCKKSFYDFCSKDILKTKDGRNVK